MLHLLAEVNTVEQKVYINVSILTAIVGVGIPMVVAFITKARASSAVKAITCLGLTILSSCIQLVIDANGVVNLRTFLSNFLSTFFVAILSYYGFTRHIGTPAVKDIVPDHGIGKAA